MLLFGSVAAIQQRYVLAIMIFAVVVNVIMMRSCLSLVMTQMVVGKIDHGNTPLDEYTCPVPPQSTDVNRTESPRITIVCHEMRFSCNISIYLRIIFVC